VNNRPLTTADRDWTDKDSRTEMHLGNAYLRMNAETSVTLTNLTDQTVQVELDQGTLNLRIRHLYDREIYEVDTPNLAFTITEAGDYRFDVDPSSDTTFVTVWKGEGVATGDGRSVEVGKGEQARFTDNASLNHAIREAPDFDGFDDWCRVRDNRQEHYESARYVSPDVIGAEDLDAYGSWRVLPTYGPVWVPRVDPGWAPYRYGHWVWLEPWGWTWVDDAPWGFAPSHYGRWVYYHSCWGWVPGPVRVRPVYAPALVAWVGGSHLSINISFGGGSGVAWFPLGYGEPYIPPYGVSRNYFHNVNVSNTRITNITNITNNYYTTNVTNNNVTVIGNHDNVHVKYVNRTVPGAVTAVSRNVLVNAQPVGRAAVRVSERDFHNARVDVAPEVAPSRASVLGANAGSATSMRPRQMVTRPVVAKMPAPEKPLPFSMKQKALEERPGRPLDDRTEEHMRIQIGQRPVKAGDAGTNRSGATPTATPMRPGPRVRDDNPVAAQPSPKAPVRNVPMPPDSARRMHTLPAVATPNPEPMKPAPRISTGNRPGSQPEQGFPARVVPKPAVNTDSPRPATVSAPDRPVFQSPQTRHAQQLEAPRREERPAPQMSGPRQELSDRRPDPAYRPAVRPENQPRTQDQFRPVVEAPRQQTPTRVDRQPETKREAPVRQSGASQNNQKQSDKDDSQGRRHR
jgi:hypothetical protein